MVTSIFNFGLKCTNEYMTQRSWYQVKTESGYVLATKYLLQIQNQLRDGILPSNFAPPMRQYNIYSGHVS